MVPASSTDAPPIGVVKVPADVYGDGYAFFRVRADLADAYTFARQTIVAAGGVLTSSGGLRAVTEPATPGRSRTSLHYTGRAIDLNVSSGMQAKTTPYIVTRDGGTDEQPLWKVYCEIAPEAPGAAASSGAGAGASSDDAQELPALVWKKGQGVVVVPRKARCICITDLLAASGWRRIPARVEWRANYMSCEWWHFQNESGLVTGQSLFGDELKKVWPAGDVDRSGLALDAVWARQSFVIPAGAAHAAPPPSPTR